MPTTATCQSGQPETTLLSRKEGGRWKVVEQADG